jgi:uncharacterized protein YdaU (DUF1376 family)
VTAVKLPWRKHYPGDFMRMTRGWSMSAKGVLHGLLDAQFDLRTLPVDPATLRRLTGASDGEWQEAWPMCEQFFPVIDGRLRMNVELRDQLARDEHSRISQKLKAVKGVEARRAKRESRRLNQPGVQPEVPPEVKPGAAQPQVEPSEVRRSEVQITENQKTEGEPPPGGVSYSEQNPVAPQPARADAQPLLGALNGDVDHAGSESRRVAGLRRIGNGNRAQPEIPRRQVEAPPPRLVSAQVWEATKQKILDAVDANPKLSNEQIARQALANSVTADQVRIAKKTRGESGANSVKH